MKNSLSMSKSTHAIISDITLDTRQLQCPMPLLKTKQALNRMKQGEIVEIFATDSGSWRDIPLFVEKSPHQLLLAEQAEDFYRYCIQKG